MKKYVIKIDGKYFSGIDESVISESSSGLQNGFHTFNHGVSSLKFSYNPGEAHPITGKLNLNSYIKRILDYLSNNDTVKKMEILIEDV